MKRMQIFFAVLAVVFATAGVFATETALPTTVFYQSTSAGANCVTEFNETPCPEGENQQCLIDRPAPAADVYISKRVDNGPCEQLKRQ